MAQIQTSDGLQECGSIPDMIDCCPRSLAEIDRCGMMCTFVNLLPSGPLWDRPKAAALSWLRSGDCAQPGVNSPPSDCTSLVNYAMHMGNVLYNLLQGALAPALRETNPSIADQTLDAWLDRLGWQDCFASACRDPGLGPLSPYEYWTECGIVFCREEAPEDLAEAVKRGIILSLLRLRQSPIMTLNAVNWIVAPLGAVVSIVPDAVEEACCDVLPRFVIRPREDGTIDSKVAEIDPQNPCVIKVPAEVIDAAYFACFTATPIYPGVLAAQCIASSVLQSGGCQGGYSLLYSCDPEA